MVYDDVATLTVIELLGVFVILSFNTKLYLCAIDTSIIYKYSLGSSVS